MYELALIVLVLLLAAVALLFSSPRKDAPDISALLKSGDIGSVSPHASEIKILARGEIPTVVGSRVSVPRGYWVPPIVLAREKATTGQKIPRVILQSFYTCHVDSSVACAVSRMIEANPTYDYVFFDDVSCLHMLKADFHPRVAAAYAKLRPGAYKCDLWRLCALYKNGGVYADMRYQTVRPLDETLGADTTLMLVNDDIPEYFCVHNCFMAAAPRSPILAQAIRRIVRSIELRQYGTETLDITGPHALGRVVASELGVERLPAEMPLPDGGLLRSLNHRAPDYSHRDWDGALVANTKMIGCRDNGSFYAKLGKLHYGTMWNRRQVYTDHTPEDMGELQDILR